MHGAESIVPYIMTWFKQTPYYLSRDDRMTNTNGVLSSAQKMLQFAYYLDIPKLWGYSKSSLSFFFFKKKATPFLFFEIPFLCFHIFPTAPKHWILVCKIDVRP